MHAYTVRIVIAGMAVYIQTTFPVGRAMYVYVWYNISQEGNARSLARDGCGSAHHNVMRHTYTVRIQCSPHAQVESEVSQVEVAAHPRLPSLSDTFTPELPL